MSPTLVSKRWALPMLYPCLLWNPDIPSTSMNRGSFYTDLVLAISDKESRPHHPRNHKGSQPVILCTLEDIKLFFYFGLDLWLFGFTVQHLHLICDDFGQVQNAIVPIKL
jgi:hypothetical protein